MATAKKKLRRHSKRVLVRTVLTTYYADHEATVVLHENSSKWASNACANALTHLRAQTYSGSVLAEVVDLVTGAVYSIFAWTSQAASM
jgi:sugar diacid utilization regulator